MAASHCTEQFASNIELGSITIKWRFDGLTRASRRRDAPCSQRGGGSGGAAGRKLHAQRQQRRQRRRRGGPGTHRRCRRPYPRPGGHLRCSAVQLPGGWAAHRVVAWRVAALDRLLPNRPGCLLCSSSLQNRSNDIDWVCLALPAQGAGYRLCLCIPSFLPPGSCVVLSRM